MGSRPGYPLYAAVNITTRCNLDCIYCYLQPRSGIDMDPGDFRMVIDDLKANHLFFVHLSGGEPFLHPSFNDLLGYTCERFDDVSVLTNGTAVRPAHLAFIEQLVRRHPIKVQVSIDSVHDEINRRTRQAGSARIRDTIRRLSESGALVAAGMVVTRHSIGSIVESIESLRETVRYFHVMCIQATEFDPGLEDRLKPGEDELGELWTRLAELRDRLDLDISTPREFERSNYKGSACGAPCAAAFSYAVIDPNLDVRPCDKVNSVKLGNLREQGLRAIWNGEPARRFVASTTPVCMSRRLPEGPAWATSAQATAGIAT